MPEREEFQMWTVPIEARSITVQDNEEDIHYPNMRLTLLDNDIFPGPNDWVTVPVGLVSNGSNTTINTNLFMTDRTMLSDLESWGVKDVRILFENNDVRVVINGEQYRFTDLNISHDPRQPHNMIYSDLWIDSVNITAARRATMEIGFLNGSTPNPLVRSNISLTIEIDNNTNGALMRQSIDSDQARAWDLEILGNNRVRIGGDEYTVREPINISFN